MRSCRRWSLPGTHGNALNPVKKDRHGRRYGAERVEYLQPFWAVPVVAIAGMRIQRVMSYLAITFVVSLVIYAVELCRLCSAKPVAARSLLPTNYTIFLSITPAIVGLPMGERGRLK
jgi:hypothetical protein